MAGMILDSKGTIKMEVLNKAMHDLYRLNGLAETLASNAKKGGNSASLIATIKRYLQTMAAQLKTHFGMVSDQATNLMINATRGSSDAGRARVLKEGLAGLKQALEIGITQTVAKHEVHREKAAPAASPEKH
jgi:hypothetical protein